MKKKQILTILLLLLCYNNYAQRSNKLIEKNIITDFGATPNDRTNDSKAFMAASDFINANGGNVRLVIPKGLYIIGEQIILKNKHYFAAGAKIINIENSNNVQIVGEKGTILRYDVGFYYGSFNPKTMKSTNKLWDCKPKNNTTSERATLGFAIQISNSQNVTIDNIVLDGNIYPETVNNMNNFQLTANIGKYNTTNNNFNRNKINFGGGYSNCGIQLMHYGIYIIKSGNVSVKNSTIKRFATDGIYVWNSHLDKNQKNILISNNIIRCNARTGIALTGGDNITIQNNIIDSTGRVMFFSTGTGIDIEAQGSINGVKVLVTNVQINLNNFTWNSAAEILTRFGNGSQNVTIANNTFNGLKRSLYLSSNKIKNSNFTISNNKFFGAKKIFIDDKLYSPANLNTIKNGQHRFQYNK